MNLETTPRPHRARVICVDDEPAVLEGLELHIGRRYELVTATSGAAALAELDRDPRVAVIVSDMRMPQMDGATFLARARERAPDSVRILLTGHADLRAAIHAVNEGQLFRFLTKPCPPPTFLAAIEAAAEQHRLITSERVLLEQTLRGSIQAMIDVLAVVSPTAFGRASRIKALVGRLAKKLGVANPWQLEVAAMLAHMGSITLPAATVDRLYQGHALTQAELLACARAPQVAVDLLAHIPRLETVRALLGQIATSTRSDTEDRNGVAFGANLLRAAFDVDILERDGTTRAEAVATMHARGCYHEVILDALAGGASVSGQVREVTLDALRPGMVFATDVTLSSGLLFVARGSEVTPSVIARVRNFPEGTIPRRVRVHLRSEEDR